MEKITKEQIDEVITKATNKSLENSLDILADYMQKYEDVAEEIGDPELKKNYKHYYHYYALISTSFKMSVDVIRKSLYELFCEEWIWPDI